MGLELFSRLVCWVRAYTREDCSSSLDRLLRVLLVHLFVASFVFGEPIVAMFVCPGLCRTSVMGLFFTYISVCCDITAVLGRKMDRNTVLFV